jgi:hypothetical protein
MRPKWLSRGWFFGSCLGGFGQERYRDPLYTRFNEVAGPEVRRIERTVLSCAGPAIFPATAGFDAAKGI